MYSTSNAKKLNTTMKFRASGAGVAGVAALMFPKLRRKHENYMVAKSSTAKRMIANPINTVMGCLPPINWCGISSIHSSDCVKYPSLGEISETRHSGCSTGLIDALQQFRPPFRAFLHLSCTEVGNIYGNLNAELTVTMARLKGSHRLPL